MKIYFYCFQKGTRVHFNVRCKQAIRTCECRKMPVQHMCWKLMVDLVRIAAQPLLLDLSSLVHLELVPKKAHVFLGTSPATANRGHYEQPHYLL